MCSICQAAVRRAVDDAHYDVDKFVEQTSPALLQTIFEAVGTLVHAELSG